MQNVNLQQGIVFPLLLALEADSMDEFLLLWELQIDKFHTLVPAKTQILHQSLQSCLSFSIAGTQPASNNRVEDLGLLDATRDSKELDQRMKILHRIDTLQYVRAAGCNVRESLIDLHRRTGEYPTRLGFHLTSELSHLCFSVANSVALIEHKATPFRAITRELLIHRKLAITRNDHIKLEQLLNGSLLVVVYQDFWLVVWEHMIPNLLFPIAHHTHWGNNESWSRATGKD